MGHARTLVDMLPFAVHVWLGLGAITAGVPGRQSASCEALSCLDSSSAAQSAVRPAPATNACIDCRSRRWRQSPSEG